MTTNRVTHFEIPCDHPKKTMDFFETAFGWTFRQFGQQEYWLATTGDDSAQGINGAIMKKRDPNQPITHTISVEDLDKTAEAIEELGGQIVVPKMVIPNVGWLAYFKDPDGNIHGIWQQDDDAK